MKKGTNKSSGMIPVYTIHPPIVHVCRKFQPSWVSSFNLLGLTVPEKSVTKNFQCLKIGEKEKSGNKGTTKQQQLEYSG